MALNHVQELSLTVRSYDMKKKKNIHYISFSSVRLSSSVKLFSAGCLIGFVFEWSSFTPLEPYGLSKYTEWLRILCV